MKPHYQNILDLEHLITSTQEFIAQHPEEQSRGLTMLIDIERILDGHRGDIIMSARDAGVSDDEARAMLKHTNTVMDGLRDRIRATVQAGDYDELLAQRAESMKLDWKKR